MSANANSTPNSMWDERYGDEKFAYGTEANDFLKDTVPTLDLPTKARCLMIADGEGRNGVFMAKNGYDVVSMDMSVKGLEKARRLAKKEEVVLHTEVANLADYDFGLETWDCVVGIFCHVPPVIRQRMFQSIPAALKPGGYCLFECYTPAQLEFKTGGPPDPAFMFSKAILQEAFNNHLTIQRNEELVREVKEGIYHTGMGAVVQFVGQKFRRD